MKQKSKYWLVGVATLLLATFFLNGSFKNTIQRRRAIQKAREESALLNQKISHLQKELTQLQNPSEYETYVRRDLGYLRPGEKEVRFVKGGRGKNP